MKQPYNTDISVLLLFFNRADHFSQVWEQVRKARPSRLFLYQDGPREGRDDMKGILECRELVKDENIDWECEVHRNYQTKNFGCDPSEFISQRWAFSLTDKCIVLEDDDVPSLSFFPFCKEMLDKYEKDERVTLISGFNVLPMEQKKENDTYFFTRGFSIWGWASWARVVNNWDGDYGFVKDPVQFKLLKEKAKQYKQRDEMIELCEMRSKTGKEFYEFIFWAYMMLHDGMAIMPSVNLIKNIGLDGGTHYATQLELVPKRLRWQFIMPVQDMSFPLRHPSEVKEWPEYQRQMYLTNAWNNPWRKVQYSVEELWLNLKCGNFKNIVSSFCNRVKKTLGIKKHY